MRSFFKKTSLFASACESSPTAKDYEHEKQCSWTTIYIEQFYNLVTKKVFQLLDVLFLELMAH